MKKSTVNKIVDKATGLQIVICYALFFILLFTCPMLIGAIGLLFLITLEEDTTN